MSMTLTAHAAHRSRQRGISNPAIEALLAEADIDVPAGRGCRLVRVSRARLADRSVREELGPLADRLGAVAAIVCGETGAVVTVLRPQGGGKGRRYRRKS